MLYIKYASDWKHNADCAVRELCERAKGGKGKNILIVPEQNSFDAELALCRTGGDAISRSAEVLSFTRLAARVFSVAGGTAVSVLENSGRMIAMAAALEMIRPKLKLYKMHVAKPEFLRQLLRIVEEFHGYGLNIQSVRGAAENLGDPLTAKLEELLLILETYDMVCAGAKQDPSTRLDRLRDALYDCDYAKNAWIAVNGFTDFTSQEMAVLEALTVQAERVTVYLTCDGIARGRSLFDIPRKTAVELERMAKRNNVLVRMVPELRPGGKPELEHLAAQLFAPRLQPWEGEADCVTLCQRPTAQEETEAAVGYMQSMIQKGARWREIAVIYSDETVYRPLLENILDRYEIPAYYSGSRDILRQPMIRAVVFALEAAAQGMEPESVAEYLKSGYAPITRDDADRLENYAYVWNLRGNRWNGPFTDNPAGFRTDRNPAPEQLSAALETINRAREQAVAPLCELRKSLAQAVNLEEQVLALERFFQSIHLEEQLNEKIESLLAQNALQAVQELSQLYEILLETMEQIFGVLGRASRSPEEFYSLFRAALTENTVGTIPATLDSVRVGKFSDMRNVRAKYLVILGATDGMLPTADRAGGLLSDPERRVMQRAGLTVAPDDSERLDRELLTAYTVFCTPTERLFVSGSLESPSFLLTRLYKVFPNRAEQPLHPVPVREIQAAAILAAESEPDRRAALNRLPWLSESAGRLMYRAGYAPGMLDRHAVESLYGSKLNLDSTRMELFASCKYAYFLRYGLKIRERKQARVDASVYGIFVHDVLEHTVRAVEAEGGFHTVSEERTLELAEQFCDRFVEQKLNGLKDYTKRGSYLLHRNYQEILAVVRELHGEMRQSAFIPRECELKFENETAIPITGDVAVGSLRGVVDRVDLYTTPSGKTYLRVVDYKTGRKDFDYTDLLEGMGLQMLIYLFALTREAERFFGKKMEPAGVLYFPARYDVESVEVPVTAEEAEKKHRAKLRRKGLLLDDESVLQAMEPDAEPVYLPYRVVKKTGLRTGNLATADQMRLISRHVMRTLGRLADEMMEGRIDPNPYWRQEDHNACRWCEYREVCHVGSGEVSMRRLRATKQEQFWEILEKEESTDG